MLPSNARCSGTVAAPSGTTANVLNLAVLFGFTPEELGVLRLAMCAWMLATDDHSFFEIMLAAQPHMPPQLQISVVLHDFGQLWPRAVNDGCRFVVPMSTPASKQLSRVNKKKKNVCPVWCFTPSVAVVRLVMRCAALARDGAADDAGCLSTFRCCCSL